jgi:FkbM family methyltransferase
MVKLSKVVRHWRRVPELYRVRQESPAWKQIIPRFFEIGTASYPFSIPLRGGGSVQVTSPNEVKVFWQIFVSHCYRIPADCRTVIDAGANIGLFALWAARQLPAARIVSLEPFPQTFQLLQQNIRANSLQDRILLLQRALAADNGERRMSGFGESPNHRLILAGGNGDGSTTVTVACSTLADLLREQRLESLDLLKLDVEGSEWEILFATPPAVLKTIRHIVLEYHEVHERFGYKPEQLFAHLASGGHQLKYRMEDRSRTGIAFLSRG